MSYVDDTKKDLEFRNKKTNEKITFTRRERYKSNGMDIEVYFSQGYKQKLILVNGNLVTGRSRYEAI